MSCIICVDIVYSVFGIRNTINRNLHIIVNKKIQLFTVTILHSNFKLIRKWINNYTLVFEICMWFFFFFKPKNNAFTKCHMKVSHCQRIRYQVLQFEINLEVLTRGLLSWFCVLISRWKITFVRIISILFFFFLLLDT